MYPMAPAYSEARWLEKCSTLIGSGTTAWALIFRQRGHVCHSPPDSQTACRILPFLYADISGVTDFQLLADGDNILYLDNYRIQTNRKLQERLVILSRKPL